MSFWLHQLPILFEQFFNLWKLSLVCSLAFQRLYHKRLDLACIWAPTTSVEWIHSYFGDWSEAQTWQGCRKKKYFKYKSMCYCKLEALYMRCYRFENNRYTKLRNYSLAKKSDHCLKSCSFLLSSIFKYDCNCYCSFALSTLPPKGFLLLIFSLHPM